MKILTYFVMPDAGFPQLYNNWGKPSGVVSSLLYWMPAYAGMTITLF